MEGKCEFECLKGIDLISKNFIIVLVDLFWVGLDFEMLVMIS